MKSLAKGFVGALFFVGVFAAPQLALANSQTYSTPGTYTFIVPDNTQFTVQVWGSGGGGGGSTAGTAGKDSSFGSLLAHGGTGGAYPSTMGAGGTASGGTTNTTGGNAPLSNPPNGGSSPNGGTGGTGGSIGVNGKAGSFPGAGGGGGYFWWHDSVSNQQYADTPIYGGGGGGYTTKSYSITELPAGTAVTVVVGKGGSGGKSGGDGIDQIISGGGAGASGEVKITWTPKFILQCDGVPRTYSSPGTFSTTVPDWASALSVQVWGAGGGGATGIPADASSPGGGGGYTVGAIPVNAGQTVSIIVGQGGSPGGDRTIGGGGKSGSGQGLMNGSGGGRSAVLLDSVEEMTAAGGGGAGVYNPPGGYSVASYGGAGGGATGQNGQYDMSTGGSSSHGGVSGGTQLQGGDGIVASNVYLSGGGGGGWYGGGGAHGTSGCTKDCGAPAGFGGGAGGSGYCGPDTQSCSTVGGSGRNPAGTNEANYPTGIGIGGLYYSVPAGDGSVVISCTSNFAPSAPTITGPSTGLPNTQYTYNFTATDPEGDKIRYAVDWDNSGNIDEWVPSTGSVASGVSASTQHAWTTGGTYTFEVLARDVNKNRSDWTTKRVTIASPAPTALLTCNNSAGPCAYLEGGDDVVLEWSSQYADTCTGTNFSTGNATSGSINVAPGADTTYKVTCTGSGGTANSSVKVTFVPDNPPDPPTVSLGRKTGTSFVVTASTNYSFTLTTTDPDSDTLNYDVQWVVPGGAGTWLPSRTSYVQSGVSQSAATATQSIAGPETFRVRAEDSRGQLSSWTSVTLSCNATESCQSDGKTLLNSCTLETMTCPYGCTDSVCNSGAGQLSIHASPTRVAPNTSTTLYWDAQTVKVSTCVVSGSDGETWSKVATSTASGTTTTAINGQTIFTLTCKGIDGVPVSAATTVNVTPIYRED